MSKDNYWVTIAVKNNTVVNTLIGTEKECIEHFDYLEKSYGCEGTDQVVVIRQHECGMHEIIANSVTKGGAYDEHRLNVFQR